MVKELIKKSLGTCPDCGTLRRKIIPIDGSLEVIHYPGVFSVIRKYQQNFRKCGYDFGTTVRASTSADYPIL
ncbi:MAG: hypothetical protein GF368_06020 [Candidatus Aenigmarchaeota archaeon]|nr:hypothetical protein [Candidatus Aenigmarchaeota archaeon]